MRHFKSVFPGLIVAMTLSLLTGCSDGDEDGATGELTSDASQTVDVGGTVDTGPDVAVDVATPDIAVPIDAGPTVKEFIACTENADCDSGWCVESADGKTCTETCIDSCPKDWRCEAVANTGQDVTYICLPRNLTLCNPCIDDSDCAATLSSGESKCLEYGPSGRFCGSECGENVACPGGYVCDTGQCRREVGECACSWKAIKDGAKTVCSAVNEIGSCPGSRSCLSGSLSQCGASTPAVEICDDADNDCDGQTDEETAGGDCTHENEFGVCAGVEVCQDGGLSCAAPTPKLEVCDGQDNDCDGDADEGFPDSDADGLADCVSTDDDADGVLDADDNCPTNANPEQEDADNDGVGDVCDTDSDGDGDPDVTDCAPQNPEIGSKNTELCNGFDDDCDNAIDEAFPDLDNDQVADCVDEDIDGDGVLDVEDNCKVTPNPAQTDSDGDGVGDACDEDKDSDGDPDTSDCEPLNPLIHHGATEVCNGTDENCNGFLDEGFPDQDGDGVASCLDPDDDGDGVDDVLDNCPLQPNPDQSNIDSDDLGDVCDGDDDGDGDPDALDCAPVDPAVNHQATEACNGKDDDCDGQEDEADATGCAELFFNDDGDGYGLSGVSKCLCQAAPPYTATEGGDCDDKNSQIFPNASEVCNLKDDNCNSEVDEGAAIGCQDAWLDDDGDNYGVGEKACVCPGVDGYADEPGDCADDAIGVHPGALETCNGVNDDCAGGVDDPGASGCQKHYLDVDDDDYGVTTDSQCLCSPDGHYTAEVGGDCHDDDPEAYPGLIETCDSKDNNCNGQVDEGVKTTFYIDGDSDGFGAGFNSKDACVAPGGYVENGGDCNDFNVLISPGLDETCDDIDNNCNGQTDEGLPQTTVYVDLDGDGHGAQGTAGTQACLRDNDDDGVGDTAPDGSSLLGDDCNDSASLTFPGAPELCDGALNDCTISVADFQCPTTCQGVWPVAVGVTSGYVVAGQLDATNPLEVVVQGAGMVRVLRDDGSVLWSAVASVQYSNPMVADADLNGFLDVILFENSRIRVMDGATGTELESYAVTNSGWRPGIAFDLDNDGVLDFVGSGTGDKVAVVLRDGLGGSKDTFYLTPAAGTYFNGDVAAAADLDGDGIAEIIIGTGYSTCNGAGAPACLGMLLVYDVLTGELKYPADTFLVPDAENAYTGGGWPFVADLDNDGSLDIYQGFGNKVSGGVGLVWKADGTPVTLATVGNGGLVVAPVDALGNLSDGSLRNIGAGAVDLDGDGRFEMVFAGGNGLEVRDGGVTMDGYPAGAPGSTSIATDINRDGRLDVVYVGSDDAAVHCMSLGENTFSLSRMLASGARDGLGQGHYRTSGYDSFEPNDVRNVEFVPEASINPIVDARAFPMRGFVDKYSSSNGFSRALVSSLATAGDRDFYYAVGSQISLTLSALIGPTDPDLLLHMYYPDGDDYEYITTFDSLTAGNEVIDCHSSLPCPDASHTGTKLFIIEVRGHDEAVDFGPWPYRLRISYGAK